MRQAWAPHAASVASKSCHQLNFRRLFLQVSQIAAQISMAVHADVYAYVSVCKYLRGSLSLCVCGCRCWSVFGCISNGRTTSRRSQCVSITHSNQIDDAPAVAVAVAAYSRNMRPGKRLPRVSRALTLQSVIP